MIRWFVTIALLTAFAGSALAEVPQLGTDVADNVLAIRAQNPDLRDDVFAKMGGSSVESKAFLVCFSTPHVDLAGRDALQPTIDYFAAERRNAFNRTSRAAGVSWNLRYALGGRPANFRREIRDSDARWALVLFGANDAQNQNERIYVRRLVYLIEELEALGVVPVLGSASPRRNKTKDRWIQRFNAITEAVAEHWRLPYVDYYDAMAALPRKGLARDGVHPNVLGQGGVRTACQFTEKGLRYGNNVRNLLTLEMLDELRRLADAHPFPEPEAIEPVAVNAADAATGGLPASEPTAELERPEEPEPTDADSHRMPSTPTVDPPTAALALPTGFPFSAVVDKPMLLEGELPPGCGRLKANARVYRASVTVEEPTRLRATALDLDGFTPRVFWIRNDPEGPRCVRRRNQSIEVAAAPGLWDLIVEVSERATEEGRMLVLIDRNPR
ncbi:MAG: SGNH/GDSL hydrolase family protein [Myxococcota bacterium]